MFSLSALARRLEHMPMLKLLAVLVTGILLGEQFSMPLWFTAAAFVVSGVLAVLWRSSAAVCTMILATGVGLVELNHRTPTLPREVRTAFSLEIDALISERDHYRRTEATVNAWRNPETGAWHPARERVIIYTDTITQLVAGECITCHGTVHRFRNAGSSYSRLMARRGFVGTLNIRDRNIIGRTPATGGSLHLRAAEKIGRLGLSEDADAAARAMVAGDRSKITTHLREEYSRSGFSHLLAVSGLHTGIVFLLINLLVKLLPLIRYGHLWRNLAAAACVWLYVGVAGFPPSAVRAAVMCSFLQLALASASEYVALGSLSTAAVVMLLWQPAWIGDISFLLSFTAVAAIMAWGVPLCRMCRTRRRWVNILLDAYIIGFVSTLATAPLVSHTFGIFSVAGLLLGPVAIMLTTIVVLAGVMWLLTPFGALAPLFRWIVGPAAEGVNALARFSAEIPYGIMEITLSRGATMTLYALFVAATLATWCHEPKKSVNLPS